MFVAVATIIGHSSLPHLHHEVSEAIAHFNHHDEEQGSESDHYDHDQDTEDHHNIFSFAQLDDNYVPGKFQNTSIELPILYLLTPVITYQLNQLKENSKPLLSYYREFPPPGDYSSNLFSRPPPIVNCQL
jgi:hypothetical protein